MSPAKGHGIQAVSGLILLLFFCKSGAVAIEDRHGWF
jgi:hypothetical protein